MRRFYQTMLLATLTTASTYGPSVSAQEPIPVPVPNEAAALRAEQTQQAEVPTSTISIGLRGGIKIVGRPADTETLRVNTLFGEAKLPMNAVAGIRFAQQADEQTVFVLQNGDVLTGQLAQESLNIVAEWGTARIHVNHIESISFRSDLVWRPVDGPQGRRWTLQQVQ